MFLDSEEKSVSINLLTLNARDQANYLDTSPTANAAITSFTSQPTE